MKQSVVGLTSIVWCSESHLFIERFHGKLMNAVKHRMYSFIGTRATRSHTNKMNEPSIDWNWICSPTDSDGDDRKYKFMKISRAQSSDSLGSAARNWTQAVARWEVVSVAVIWSDETAGKWKSLSYSVMISVMNGNLCHRQDFEMEKGCGPQSKEMAMGMTRKVMIPTFEPFSILCTDFMADADSNGGASRMLLRSIVFELQVSNHFTFTQNVWECICDRIDPWSNTKFIWTASDQDKKQCLQYIHENGASFCPSTMPLNSTPSLQRKHQRERHQFHVVALSNANGMEYDMESNCGFADVDVSGLCRGGACYADRWALGENVGAPLRM